MKKLGIIFIWLSALSCQDIENCDTDDNWGIMIVRFFDFETKDAKKIGFAIGTGNIRYGESFFSEDSTFIGLPLNPDQKTTTFYFESDTSRFELEMSYEDLEVSIFDPKCDPSYTFLGLDTVRYTFDSLSIPGTVTNRQLSTNVEVYF